jgi:hypothetical protein
LIQDLPIIFYNQSFLNIPKSVLLVLERRSDVTGASDRQLEGVNVEALLVGVGQQPDEVVLLQTLRVILLVDERTRSGRVPGGNGSNK